MWKLAVTSEQNITPSSPTPSHLRTHNLSWIDRSVPFHHIPFILFYPNPNPNYLSTLKTSLSQTLSVFYPIAGELDSGHTFIDCNDRGARLVEAVAVSGSPLSELIGLGLNCDGVDSLHPCCNNSCRDNCSGNPLLSVQITTFSSGGMAVAVCLSHKIGDAHSAFAFTSAWAAAAASHEDQPSLLPLPTFDAASLFPSILPKRDPPFTYLLSRNLVVKRFTFDESTITFLRKSSSVTDLTRVQAVVALLWRCCMRARASEKQSRTSMARITVNMRGKMMPSLPDNLVGNFYCHVVATMTEAEAKSKLRFEENVRSAIVKIDGEKLREYKEEHGWPLMKDKMTEVMNEVGYDPDSYWFSSWNRFRFHEIDFAWGRPSWMGIGMNMPLMKNVIVLTGRRGCGDGPGGLEAWVSLEEDDMVRFKRDEEILAYASSAI